MTPNTQSEPEPPKPKRRRFAWNIGCLAVFLAGAWIILAPVFMCAREKAMDIGCESNMKALGLAALQYEQDNNERLPPSGRWADSVTAYLPNYVASHRAVFHCPAATQTRYGYAFNAKLGAVSEDAMNDPTDLVMLFESDSPSFNATGSSADVAWGRHMGSGVHICHADGHVQHVEGTRRAPNSSQATLDWTP